MFLEIWQFLQNNWAESLTLTLQHVFLVGTSMLFAIPLGLILGVVMSHSKTLAKQMLLLTNISMMVPSIALFALMMPALSYFGYGVGKVPAILALILYSLMPIIRNTHKAILQVDFSTKDAAVGIGMSRWQRLKEVEIPLAWPMILSGIHTAVILNIGIAAIAEYIGAGGLGVYIVQGISRAYPTMILAGAILVSLIAIIVDLLMAYLTKKTISPGLRMFFDKMK